MATRNNRKKWLLFLKRTILGLAVLIALIGLYMMHPQFGKRPSGERLQRIQLSKQFKDGKFQNSSPTPQLTQPWTVALYDYFFKRSKHLPYGLYLGGDSGYDNHFKEIGNQLGPFDLAILENGQYDLSWKHIHMMPEEVVQAAHDLKASLLFPVHSSKFVLANHAWNEPLERISKEAIRQQQPMLTPMIGQVIDLDQPPLTPSYWWRK
ncbi:MULTISPECIES: MBL fold metallo-hydrolase [Sphingobacterium]|uniref:MBL fold metallo-hydrolase n=1 Tax=Sphingobacterium TaxID=28453 RepID=UPI00257D9A8C|nr:MULTISPECIES: MBL fold metallo-hydrolase [Sphingobacterium]